MHNEKVHVQQATENLLSKKQYVDFLTSSIIKL